jgi:hypothetical protein
MLILTKRWHVERVEDLEPWPVVVAKRSWLKKGRARVEGRAEGQQAR